MIFGECSRLTAKLQIRRSTLLVQFWNFCSVTFNEILSQKSLTSAAKIEYMRNDCKYVALCKNNIPRYNKHQMVDFSGFFRSFFLFQIFSAQRVQFIIQKLLLSILFSRQLWRAGYARRFWFLFPDRLFNFCVASQQPSTSKVMLICQPRNDAFGKLATCAVATLGVSTRFILSHIHASNKTLHLR